MIARQWQKQGAEGSQWRKKKFLCLKGKKDEQQIILLVITPENGRGQSRATGTKMQNSNFGL
ncbi:hypothetical protein VI06_17540 [Aquitalea magnusonii]|nr:hypothetical protein VI06_17540 [Aquitalea magnusonii]